MKLLKSKVESDLLFRLCEKGLWTVFETVAEENLEVKFDYGRDLCFRKAIGN